VGRLLPAGRQAGAAVASPLTLMREYVTAVNELLAGRSVTVEGRYVRLTEVRLDWPPQQAVPVLFLAGGADQAAESAGPFVDAGVDTLVFQPAGPQTEMPALIDAAGEVAARR
jgi:alkanesulfonate monooxygenase SsuD/methylene tetrahydromethanopterin reductase-like flavin-dependent oxidoreductase (luciferase family)